MKKLFILLIPIIIITYILLKIKKKPVEIEYIKYMHFGYSTGTMINANVSYNLTFKDGKYLVQIKPNGKTEEETKEKEITKKEVKKIENILKQYEVYKWDGFNKSDQNVLDGNSFDISIILKNGETIRAYGYMKYPNNYREVKNELDNIFMEIYK